MKTIKVFDYHDIPYQYTGIVEWSGDLRSSILKDWYKDGRPHRLDGPAVYLVSGDKQWWINGFFVKEEEYQEAVLLYKCKQVLDS